MKSLVVDDEAEIRHALATAMRIAKRGAGGTDLNCVPGNRTDAIRVDRILNLY